MSCLNLGQKQGLKYNSLFTPVRFKISEATTTVDPDKIFEEIFPSL